MWSATYADGPMAEDPIEEIWMGACPRDIYVAPPPAEMKNHPWLIVGVDEPPDIRWPGQEHYRLVGDPPRRPPRDSLLAAHATFRLVSE